MIEYHCDDSEPQSAPDDGPDRWPRPRRRDRMAYREWVRAFVDNGELRDIYSDDDAGGCYQQLADDLSFLLDDDRLSAAARTNLALVSAAVRHLGKTLETIHDEKYPKDAAPAP